MNVQPRSPAAALTDKIPAKMKLLVHIYPDARSTGMIRYCSAFSRRYGRTVRAS
jgi:hypothetical protein